MLTTPQELLCQSIRTECEKSST